MNESLCLLFAHSLSLSHVYICYRVDDDLYLLCGGLFGSHDVLVLTNDHLRDKRDILDSHSHDILSQWKETRVVQLEGRKKQQYIIKVRGRLLLEGSYPRVV